MARLTLEQWRAGEYARRTDGLQDRITRIKADVDAKIAAVLQDAEKTALEMGIDPHDEAKNERLLDMSLRAAGIKLDVPDEAPLFKEPADATGPMAPEGNGSVERSPEGDQRQGPGVSEASGGQPGRPEESGATSQSGDAGDRHSRKRRRR